MSDEKTLFVFLLSLQFFASPQFKTFYLILDMKEKYIRYVKQRTGRPHVISHKWEREYTQTIALHDTEITTFF